MGKKSRNKKEIQSLSSKLKKENPVSQQQTQDSFKKSRKKKEIQSLNSKLKTRSKSLKTKKSSLSASNSRLVQKVSKQKGNPVSQQQTQDSFKKSRKQKKIQSLSSKVKTRSKSLE